MTIQEKVKGLRPQLALYRDEATSNTKRWAFGLLHDAILFTGEEAIDKMKPKALAFFVEMMACAHLQDEPDVQAFRMNLLRLGFSITPASLPN
jgi:hypothetical protein